MVLSGHQHSYERLAIQEGGDTTCPVQYIVNGVGGAEDLNLWTPFPWWRIWVSGWSASRAPLTAPCLSIPHLALNANV